MHTQDLRRHLQRLDEAGLLVRVTEPVCKDTELMPLVRWQFRGLPEAQRRAFLFENVVDANGKRYDGSVAVGIYAASTQVYALGMGCRPEEITRRWMDGQVSPIQPRVVEDAPAHEEVHIGDNLLEHGGIGEFAMPISTPGFDIAPYTTASKWVTRDPDTGWINVGNYRGQLKAPDRMGVFISPRNHGWAHWEAYRKQGRPMPAALVVGGPPVVTYTAGSRIPYGTEEYAVAGGLLQEAVELVRCKTVDLLVPAHAELIIEGYVSTEYLEPEAPFGEYTGYMGKRVYNGVFQATCITHKKKPIFTAIMSQMPPSESSKMKQIAQENNYLKHLVKDCNLPDVKAVSFHEIAMDSWCVIQMKQTNPSNVWQALYAVAGRHSMVGKMVIAVDEDIDPTDPESVIWALSYRMQPERDTKVLSGRSIGLDPSGGFLSSVDDMTKQTQFGSCILIDATRKYPYPPVALPAREFMEKARQLWDKLGLPPLQPRMPWHGYELGDWTDRDREESKAATEGAYYRTGDRAATQRRPIDK